MVIRLNGAWVYPVRYLKLGKIVGYMRILFVLFSVLMLGACTTAGPITYLSYGKTLADLISYLATNKTTTEHGLDFLTGQDCKFSYVLEEKDIKEVCRKREIAGYFKEVRAYLGQPTVQ